MPLSSSQLQALRALSLASPRALPTYAYGTSGFRGLATTLDAVTLRMAMLGAVRSWEAGMKPPVGAGAGAASSSSSSSSASSSPRLAPAVGLMVTASHNDAPDNGVKLIDPSGEMMEQSWEAIATRVANCAEADLPEMLQALIEERGIDTDQSKPRVFVARDTRQSSPHLRDLVLAGAKAMGAEVVDFGLACTPQLHWLVREANEARTASIEQYYDTMADSFRTALACSERASAAGGSVQLSPLVLDCANGVGALSIAEMSKRISSVLAVEPRNTGSGELNGMCGAEHVQKGRALPVSFSAESDVGKKLASLDGDADRLVYFYVDAQRGFRLLDGDKIIALYTLFLRDLLTDAGLAGDLSIGIVQTAYANGASTLYMQQVLGCAVEFTNTGVKHLHHAAVAYDVGVYFESNGHGTVVFSKKAREKIAQAVEQAGEEQNKQARAARCLAALLRLINQCIGDAISDLLLVEVALYHRNWTLADWDGVYEDLPSSMLKVRVADRTRITTTNAERVCVTPAGLQSEIDRLVATLPPGSPSLPGQRRAFIRPSGTEDVVRVYAEASTREEVDLLAKQVCEVTAKLAGGV